MAATKPGCINSLEKVQDAVNAADDVSLATFGIDAETMIAMLNGISDPKVANSFMLKTAFLKAEGVFFEGAMGAMLSSYTSHITNDLGNGFTYGMNFIDSGLTAVSATVTGDAVRSATAQRMFVEQLTDFGRTVKDFGKLMNPYNDMKGWKALEDVPYDLLQHPDFLPGSQQASTRVAGYTPDPAKRKGDAGEMADRVRDRARSQERQISSTNLGISNKNPIGKGVGIGVDVAGAVVNSFGNAMRHQDLAAKTLQFRLALRKEARLRAEKIVRGKMAEEGLSESDALNMMDKLSTTIFKYPDEDLLAKAATKANDDTFTGELGSFAGSFRSALQKPVLRVLTPFFKTLAQLTNYGVRESPIGELGRALHIYKGEDYWTKLGEKSARGDAARSQAAMSAFMVYGTYAWLTPDPMVDGFGFTGHLDMTNPIQRQRALSVAPPFSWKFKDGSIMEFGDIPPLQVMAGMYSGGQEMITKLKEGRQYFDPDTGAEIEDPATFIWDVMTTPTEHMFGNHFAMESFSKIDTLFEALLTGDEGSKLQAQSIAADIATMWMIPAITKDINAVGALIEQRTEVPESQRFFNDTYQQAHTLLQRIDNAWFGGENSGTARDMFGNEKKSKHGLTLQVQSSKYSNWPEKPDEVDFRLFELKKVRPLDNPEVISLPGLGTEVKLTPKQTDAFMVLLGKGIPDGGTGLKAMSQREFLRKVMFHPRVTERPEFVQEAIIQQMVREREGAFKLLFVKMNPDLEEQARANVLRKGQLMSGELDIKGPGYFPKLFESIDNVDKLLQNFL